MHSPLVSRALTALALTGAALLGSGGAGADVAPPRGQHAVDYGYVVANIGDFPEYLFVTLHPPRPVSPYLEIGVVGAGATSGKLYAIKRSDVAPPLRITTGSEGAQLVDAWDGGLANASEVTKLVEGDAHFMPVKLALDDTDLSWRPDDKPPWSIVDHVRITACCEPGKIEAKATKVVYTIDGKGTTREIAYGADGHRPPPAAAASPSATAGSKAGGTDSANPASGAAGRGDRTGGCGCATVARDTGSGGALACCAAALVFARRARRTGRQTRARARAAGQP